MSFHNSDKLQDKWKDASLKNNNAVGGTYWDGRVQWFPIGVQVSLPDIQHVDLRAGHHDADQGGVLGPGSLLKKRRVELDCESTSSTHQPAYQMEMNARRIAVAIKD